MAHGLIRGSFVPDEPTEQMRIEKTLEDANIKLDSVISDVVGVSGRRMLEALINGKSEPQELASLAHGRIRATGAQLEVALRGRVTMHHRFLVRLHLDHLDAVDAATARIDQDVGGQIEPFRTAGGKTESHPWRQFFVGRGHGVGGGSGHESIPNRGPFHQLGWSVPQK